MPITPILITEGLTTSGAQMESQSYSPLSDMGDLVDETFHPHGNTPPRRTKKSAAISSAHEKKTDELDGCRCFVTNVYSPGISIQSAYILAGEAEPDTLRELEIKWGYKANELHLSTRRNVIHLRRDWHATFDAGYWALVPSEYDILTIRLRYSQAVTDQKDVSPTLPQIMDKNPTHTYRIVFFSPLAKHVYHRATNDDQTEFEKLVVDDTGVSRLFDHHSDPYFAILNAVPKFDLHHQTLTKEQKQIFQDLKGVVDAWDRYFSLVRVKRLRPPEKGGSSGNGDYPSGRDAQGNPDDSDNHDSGPSRTKRPRIAKDTEDNSGTSGLSSRTDDHDYGTGEPYWDDVISWLNNVAKECEPVPDQIVEWPVDEPPRPPPRSKPMVRYDWSIPPTEPEKSNFSSTDWAMYHMGSALERSLSPLGHFD